MPPSPVHQAASLFKQVFGESPRVAASAPGRVNLIGDHVDYCGGPVLPAAIEQRAAVCASTTPGPGAIHICSREHSGEAITFEPGDVCRGHWSAYLAGSALVGWDSQSHDVRLAVASEVPIGAGLSSSAAVEMATVLACARLRGQAMPPLQAATLAQRAEHEFAGVPCGIMDQYTVAHAAEGSALLIDCDRLTHRTIVLPDSLAFIVVDSGVKHSLAFAAYAERREACEAGLAAMRRAGLSVRCLAAAPLGFDASNEVQLTPVQRRRVRHVITESARVRAAAEALACADLASLGRLMNQSHESLKRDFEVSCPEVDDLVEEWRQIEGVLGARMTGAGFGGCIVAAVRREKVGPAVDAHRSRWHSARRCWVVKPGGAARLEVLSGYDGAA